MRYYFGDLQATANQDVIQNIPFFCCACRTNPIKDTLSGLRQFLATESPLKMRKNAFYFTLKALLVLKIFQFLSCIETAQQC